MEQGVVWQNTVLESAIYRQLPIFSDYLSIIGRRRILDIVEKNTELCHTNKYSTMLFQSLSRLRV